MEFSAVIRQASAMAKLFVVCAAAGFLAGYLSIAYFGASPQKVFKASTFNTTLTDPVRERVKESVKDGGWVIFLSNSLLAVLFISPVFLAGSYRFKNFLHSGMRINSEDTIAGKFDLMLIKTMGLTAACDKRIISLSFSLNVVNRLATGILAFLTGALCPAAAWLLSSPILVFAALAPHGVIEIPAFFVAAAFPLALFGLLKSAVEKDAGADTFMIARNAAFSRTTVVMAAAVFIALAAAAHIEDKITPKAVKYFRAQQKNAAEKARM